MAGVDVGNHLLDQVAQPAAVPQMVVRVDDRAGGVDDLLGILRQPVFAWIGIESAGGGGGSADSHRSLPDYCCCLLFVIARSTCDEAIHLSVMPCHGLLRSALGHKRYASVADNDGA